jgi:hypothetical protein
MHPATLPRRVVDLRVFGAATLPDRELVRLVCGARIDDAEVTRVTSALELAPVAREAVLLESPYGPRLLAALELGRRAGRLPSSALARIDSPGSLVAAMGPRLHGDQRWWLVAVDVRLRLARAIPFDFDEPRDACSTTALQATFQAGCRRFVLVRRVLGPAAWAAADVDWFCRLRVHAETVGVCALDAVQLGDDGWCSMVRQGVVAVRDHRYR